jgi:bacterioferritin-associated ferredoxin
MIVCTCFAISDRQMREAAASGISLREFEAEIGVGTECGECRADLARIFEAQQDPGREGARHPQKHPPPKRSAHEG